jgi:hypothetical protein
VAGLDGDAAGPVRARPRPAARTLRRGVPFFTASAALCVLFAFGGFSTTYFIPMATGSSREVAPVVHIHGVLFFAWTLLFLAQTLLVTRGRTARHRSVGLAGVALATAMVIFGSIVSLLANARRVQAGELERAYDLGFGNTVAMVAFGTMFALAIGSIRRPDRHKRWMLLASCMLLNAPVGRLYRPLFAPGPPWPWLVFATVDVILIACLVHDRKTLGRPHPVTLIGGSILVAARFLRSTIAATPLWRATYDALLQLVG